MAKIRQYPVRVISLSLIAIVVTLLIMAICMLQLLTPRSYAKTVSVFAEQLSFTSETKLAEYKTCWGIFPTTCGQVLYYSTPIDVREFNALIDTLYQQEALPQTVDGYTVMDINLVTSHTLAINGISDPSARTQIPKPVAYKWRISVGDEVWVITFYETGGDGNVYEIDGQQIVGNIVTIMLILK